MVRWHFRRADLGEHGGARDPHQLFLVVERQDPGTDVLDARVYHIESILSRVDIRDDPVVDINESLFCPLDTQKHSVEKLCLVHLIRRQANLCLFHVATLRVDLEAASHGSIHLKTFFIITN